MLKFIINKINKLFDIPEEILISRQYKRKINNNEKTTKNMEIIYQKNKNHKMVKNYKW